LADEIVLEPKQSLKYLDVNVFNAYISELINDNKEYIEKEIVDENITQYQIKSFSFDIASGKAALKFHARYKGKYKFISYSTQGDAEVIFNLITADDYPKIGIYLLEVTDFSLNNCPEIIDDYIREYINKKLANKQIWPDRKERSNYVVIKNDTLCEILNRILINDAISNEQLKPIEAYVPGGKVDIGFKNIRCELFDISGGKIRICSDFSSKLTLYNGTVLASENAGTVVLELDLYIDSTDYTWWAKIDSFKTAFNGIDQKMNDFLHYYVITLRSTYPSGISGLILQIRHFIA